MADEWFVRVQGKEYGPVDLETLREWKQEGRLIADNELRKASGSAWVKASATSEIFGDSVDEKPAPLLTRRRTFVEIIGETFRIYGGGFFQFLGLTLLVTGPSICAQVLGTFTQGAPSSNADLGRLAAAGVALCMLVLSIVMWPIYLAGIQILTAELISGNRTGFPNILNKAARFWPRVAALCIIVYGVFALLMVLAMAIAAMIVAGATSITIIFLALALLVFQIWMFGRWFINVLFWQQTTVLEGLDTVGALRRSKQIARSGRELPWFHRPAWRGTLLASLWVAFVVALNWPLMAPYLHTMLTASDPQVLMESLTDATKNPRTSEWMTAIWLIQKILQPLVGIAFVVLYMDAKSDPADASDTR